MAAELIKCSLKQFETYRAELNEFDDEKIHENVKKIQDWYQTQEHLPQNYDKRIIHTFLRGCKNDLVRVKRKLNVYFLLRAEIPEFYANRNFQDTELKLVHEIGVLAPLPHPTPDGYRITYFDIPEDVDMVAVFKYVMMVSDIRILEEENIRGDIFIFNVEKFSAKLLAKLMTPFTKKALMAAQEAYPQRLRSIHIINSNLVAEKAMNLVKIFLKPAMKKRFHVHSKLDTLFQHIPKSSLPQELGGDFVSLAKVRAAWRDKIESYLRYFAEQENIHTDRDKIVSKDAIIQNDAFGIEGNFRRLNVD